MTDTVTGLIWLKQANCLPADGWAAANQSAAALKDGDCGLTDKTSAGDWRLPTKHEWSTTIAHAVALGCVSGGPAGSPTLTDDAGTACYGTGSGSSFTSVAPDAYWLSTSNGAVGTRAWFGDLSDGILYDFGSKSFGAARGWPVRGGPR